MSKGGGGPTWPKKGLNATLALGIQLFSFPTPFYPNFRGPNPLRAFATHPNGHKGSKKAQKGPKWLKMTKNGPKSGSRHQF